MRRLTIVSISAGMILAAAGAASAEGTDLLVVTAVDGGLVLTGGSASVALPGLSGNPGAGFSDATSGGLMTVADLRIGANGWNVTAQYQAPPTSIAGISLPTGVAQITGLGAENIKVKPAATGLASGVTASFPSSFVSLGSSPIVVANAASSSFAGISTFTPSYQVRVPGNTSAAASVFGATIVYTIGAGPSVSGLATS